MRFCVVKESSQSWSVFDRVFGLPAQMDGQMLVRLTRHEAKRKASKANEMLARWRPTGAVIPGAGDAAQNTNKTVPSQ